MEPKIFRGGGELKGEYLDVLDEFGGKTGKTKLRSEVHRDGDWHRAVDVWIVNSQNQVLLQRRSKNKDSWPGKLDISSGGHLVAGETAIAGAVSELAEELGIKVEPTELEYLLSWRSSTRPAPNFYNNSFNDLYLLCRDLDLNALILQKSEVSEAIWVPAVKLQQMVTSGDRELVPHPEAYAKLFEILNRQEH